MAAKLTDCLANWAALNLALLSLTEEKKCLELLEAAKKSKRLVGVKRTNYLLRIYGRYSRLRSAREREELMK